jgi:hypothetical protein
MNGTPQKIVRSDAEFTPRRRFDATLVGICTHYGNMETKLPYPAQPKAAPL